jgi:8-oxo-dGTP pyrophosphatase MutT (NUDIX family)
MIYRNGKWDLPKGKLEKGETPEIAALREVQEECGLSNLKIKGKLSPTYHTYIEKGQPILKKTWWYEMIGDDRRKLKPQTEEGITQVAWLDDIGVYNALKNTYASIVDVVQQD